AALEVALDRGQIDDWFGSPFICWMLAIGVIGWIATIAWEIQRKEPVIDFRLLASRNFAIASALFLVFGFGLFGSTTLIPKILQSLYGYRATDAGLVLGPGALVITMFAPIAAQLIQRQIVAPRVFAAQAGPEQQGFKSNESLPELGRQFWDCLHYNCGGTPAPVPSDKSRI